MLAVALGGASMDVGCAIIIESLIFAAQCYHRDEWLDAHTQAKTINQSSPDCIPQCRPAPSEAIQTQSKMGQISLCRQPNISTKASKSLAGHGHAYI